VTPKPLFIPLKRQHFEAFKNGHKTIEYRRYGGQWREKHCYPGRSVTLSNGYSGLRISAEIVKFETRVMDSETYGPQVLLALIHLRVAASPRTENLFPTSPSPER
jgi:hypothetical protein